ncbi:hypothetical protein AEM51_12425 [Bacteroidetes bacterium UKL13-3]|nr:hypothetical protein AEM51_12425 [Bacteroidetes bacterium UKL13-3]
MGCAPSNNYSLKVSQDQADKSAAFLHPEKSPLTVDEIQTFKGLHFFEPNEQFKVQAVITWLPQIGYVDIPQTGGDIIGYMQTAVLDFSIDRKSFQLPAYQTDEMKRNRTLFIPFTDLTNGKETYSGGRYIDLPYNDHHKEVLLDFNYSYIPYCAYTSRYSCPKVPRENHLDMDITAGERMVIE